MKVLEEKKPWNIRVKCTGNGNDGGGCDSLLLVKENFLKEFAVMQKLNII